MRPATHYPFLITLLIMALLASALPAYQAPAARLVLVSTLDGPPLPAALRILERYDAFVLAEVAVEDLPALLKQYSVDQLPERTILSLNGTVFDTSQGEPAIAPDLRAAPDDPYFLVQFYGPVKREWIATLEALGVTFLGYHPSFAFIVRMDPALLPQVRAAHAVQWVGSYHPAYRLASAAEMARALTYEGRSAFWVRGFPGEDPAALQPRLEAAGATVELLSPTDPPLVRIWTTPQQLPQLAALQGVYRIVPYDPPTLQNERSVQVMGTWDVWRANRNGLLQDLMGAGQIAGMVDSGLDDNDTTARINDFYDWTGGTQATRIAAALSGRGCAALLCSCYADDDVNSSGHGTHVAGSIVGNGYNALLQRGLQSQAQAADPYFDYAFGVGQAPEAQIVFVHAAGRYFLQPGTLCGLGDSYTTWEDVYNQGARNVNNSWGNSTTTYGGTDDVNADRLMWTYQDYLVLAAASNAGPGWDTVCQPGTAKNILTVGATGNHRSVWGLTSDTAGLLTDFSSRGPVNPGGGDGRAKPDVVAPGADVLSTRTTFIDNANAFLWANEPGDGDADGHLDYEWSGGTSMSCPNVTGAATIVRDYLQDIQGLGAATPPSAALVKAFLMNGAVDLGYGYESFSAAPYGGRNLQGWGMVNVEQSITPRAPRSFFFEDFTNIDASIHQSSVGFSASGQWVEYSVTVADSSEPLKVTLTWTDYQNGSSGPAVNDLNLLVTAPDGTQYLGNVFSGSWSTTGGSADSRNNTEAVYIRNPATGPWTIRVTAANAPSGVQPYSLVASGGLGPNPSYSRSCSFACTGQGRSGGSAQQYFPSLKPLAGSQEHTAPGGSFATSFRLTNWGTSADTISLSSSTTDMRGNSIAGISVSFSPAGPFNLASGASEDVQATVSVEGAVAGGAYDVAVTATSGGSGKRADVLVIGLNVIPNGDVSNEKQVVLDPAAQFAPDFWGTGQTLWVAYLSAESHNNSEAEIWTARSTDGGQTWTKMGQVDANDGAYYLPPAIAGRSNGGSITVVWTRADSTAVYARTWNANSNWGAIATLASYSGYILAAEPDVIYDNNNDILAVWAAYRDASTMAGIFSSQSTDNGTSWSTAVAVPDASASGVAHRWPALTLDTSRNDVWMALAWRIDGTNRDIRVKRWDGDGGGGGAWDAAGTYYNVANTTNREIHPGITYVAGSDALWVAWQRYPDYSAATAQVYYARNTAALPTPSFPTTYGPYGTRTAEALPPTLTGDSSYTYIAYLSYNDPYRGGNVYMLRAPAAGGAADLTQQICATVDDPPLYARGNGGTPRLSWLTTTINGQTFSGPTLLYSKNPPDNGDPDYSSNLGTSQILRDMGENFDLYLAQAGNAPTAVKLVSFAAAPASAGVRVIWETASEHDNLGFNLYRSVTLGDRGEQLNQTLIPSASPGGDQGASYAFLDATALSGVTYYYTLEDVDYAGRRTPHGPVVFTPWWVYLPLVAK